MGLGYGLATALLFSGVAWGSCEIQDSNRKPTAAKSDALYLYLQKQTDCPTRVQDLKAGLVGEKFSVVPAMVANRGRHNSEQGSFSFFETVTGNPTAQAAQAPGDFFFGHFTGVEAGELALLQNPDEGALLVEALAWDARKGLYNFYELIGTGTGAQWFYRGDSADALRDNQYLYRNVPTGKSKFGNTMRCSACHGSGGPIMKELHAPFNDWWTKARPLTLTPNRPNAEVTQQIQQAMDASDFSRAVQTGMRKLENSPAYQAAKSARSMQERLRPIFCETEINLQSDLEPLDGAATTVQVPSSALLAPYWGAPVLKMQKSDYQSLLALFGTRFPEIRRTDADHAWLTPVKGMADLLAVESLIGSGLVAKEWVEAVYAVDMETPLFSAKRCGLLKGVPESDPKDLLRDWQVALKADPSDEARELLTLLTDPKSGSDVLLKRARDVAFGLEQKLSTEAGRKALFKKLLVSRAAVLTSEISRNPRGQILEPEFRVIFPVATRPNP